MHRLAIHVRDGPVDYAVGAAAQNTSTLKSRTEYSLGCDDSACVPHFGMDLQEAIEAPRVASHNFPSFVPFSISRGAPRLRGESHWEPGMLSRIGPDVPDWSEWTWPAGSIELIRTKPESGLISVAADSRPLAYVIVH
jgi:hypothetical protein